jgi:glycosyltransferase involved in cell wall biosynthesis
MKPIVIMANNVQELGGAQVVVHSLAKVFVSNGHKCFVVGVTPHAEPHDFGKSETTTLMPRIWPLSIPDDPQNAKDRTELRSTAASNLADLLNSLEPGFVIAAQLWSLEILLDAMKHVHLSSEWRIIGQYHGSFSAAASGRDLKRAVRLAPSCDVFAVLTREDAQAFAQCGLTNVMVIPNPSTWNPSPIFTRSPKKYIDFIGRFSAEKGPDLALAGFELARAELGSEARLRMIGSGPLESELREQAGPQVEFVAPTTDIESILRESGVLLLTSRTEGAPLVVAEALAAGVPVIATDCSAGIREFFEATEGAYTDLIARENPRAIAESLIKFSRAQATAMPMKSQVSSSSYENWTEVFDLL